MAVTLDRQEIFELAKLGAEARLRELESERAQLLRTFPGLRAGGAATARAAAPQNDAPVRRRREMNAAERKSVSLRMKKYWAERRKAKAANAKND